MSKWCLSLKVYNVHPTRLGEETEIPNLCHFPTEPGQCPQLETSEIDQTRDQFNPIPTIAS